MGVAKRMPTNPFRQTDDVGDPAKLALLEALLVVRLTEQISRELNDYISRGTQNKGVTPCGRAPSKTQGPPLSPYFCKLCGKTGGRGHPALQEPELRLG